MSKCKWNWRQKSKKYCLRPCKPWVSKSRKNSGKSFCTTKKVHKHVRCMSKAKNDWRKYRQCKIKLKFSKKNPEIRTFDVYTKMKKKKRKSKTRKQYDSLKKTMEKVKQNAKTKRKSRNKISYFSKDGTRISAKNRKGGQDITHDEMITMGFFLKPEACSGNTKKDCSLPQCRWKSGRCKVNKKKSSKSKRPKRRLGSVSKKPVKKRKRIKIMKRN